ncbi:uncharacterized protein LOC121874105 [Homarus americanus]|uniref:uncharacterized protein LOC121874105 n=1 Tax=Homarus americanus TaxID=6706 RepID=UPI001C48D447|nr:uncharacterized protein LOC121874105 [Homarus americanus]
MLKNIFFQVKMEEVLVKEEPAGWFPDTEEGLENLQYTEADTSLGYGGQQATYQGGCLPWELAAVASQAHTLDAHLPQGIPGPSRIQGTEDPSQTRPMNEKFVLTDILEAASSHKSSFVDIGTLDLSYPKRFSAPLIKMILTTKFLPHKHWKPPQRQFGKYRRRVPEKLFNNPQYPMLRYSVAQDGLYCAPCVAFQNIDAILVSKPLQDWSNAIRHTMYHLQSEGHRYALQMADKFLKSYEAQKCEVDTSSSELSSPAVAQEPSSKTVGHNPPPDTSDGPVV